MDIPRTAQRIVATSAIAFAVAACGQQSDATVGQKIDGAIASTEQAANQAGQDVQAVATEVRREGQEAAQAVASSASDVAITARVKAALAADSQLSALSINVDTVNSVVSLYGPAPSAEAIERASVLAKAVEGVTAVNNRLVVSAS